MSSTELVTSDDIRTMSLYNLSDYDDYSEAGFQSGDESESFESDSEIMAAVNYVSFMTRKDSFDTLKDIEDGLVRETSVYKLAALSNPMLDLDGTDNIESAEVLSSRNDRSSKPATIPAKIVDRFRASIREWLTSNGSNDEAQGSSSEQIGFAISDDEDEYERAARAMYGHTAAAIVAADQSTTNGSDSGSSSDPNEGYVHLNVSGSANQFPAAVFYEGGRASPEVAPGAVAHQQYLSWFASPENERGPAPPMQAVRTNSGQRSGRNGPSALVGVPSSKSSGRVLPSPSSHMLKTQTKSVSAASRAAPRPHVASSSGYSSYGSSSASDSSKANVKRKPHATVTVTPSKKARHSFETSSTDAEALAEVWNRNGSSKTIIKSGPMKSSSGHTFKVQTKSSAGAGRPMSGHGKLGSGSGKVITKTFVKPLIAKSGTRTVITKTRTAAPKHVRSGVVMSKVSSGMPKPKTTPSKPGSASNGFQSHGIAPPAIARSSGSKQMSGMPSRSK